MTHPPGPRFASTSRYRSQRLHRWWSKWRTCRTCRRYALADAGARRW